MKTPYTAMPLALVAVAACGGGEASATEIESARRAQAAALTEIADALLVVDKSGAYLGARFVASLGPGAGGQPLVRIYAGSPTPAIAAVAVVDQVIGRNQAGVGFLYTDTQGLRMELQEAMLEVYSDQFTGLEFVLTSDPTQANLFVFETTFIPNPQHPQPISRDNNYSAYSMIAESEPPLSIITLNTGGRNDLTRAIATGYRAQIEGTFLNEMMNALGTRDLQDVDFDSLSYSTRLWGARLERDHGNSGMDRFTITRSKRTGPGSELLEMDLMVVRRILEDAARPEER